MVAFGTGLFHPLSKLSSQTDRDTLGTRDNAVSAEYCVYYVCAFVLGFCHACSGSSFCMCQTLCY